MSQAYSDPTREDDPHALPDVETFYATEGKLADWGSPDAGWYYWFCFPGCLPDTDPVGPFSSEGEAIKDAQSNADWDGEDDDETPF